MHFKTSALRIFALFTAVLFGLALALGITSAQSTELSGTPVIRIEYSETAGVNAGTIRYVNQNLSSAYYYESYWGRYAEEAYEQCGTACVSMALSYIGIDALPEALADLWGADGGSFGAHFYNPPEGVSVYSGDFYTEFQNYLTGNGTYSPVIIHLDSYSSNGHFVLVTAQLSDNVYQVVDPYLAEVWSMTIVQNADGTLTLTYTKSGSSTVLSETTTLDAMRCIQYYNPDARIHETDLYDIYDTEYEDAVNAVISAGLFTGTAEGTFEPERRMTRQEAAMVFYRMAGTPEVDLSSPSYADYLEDPTFAAALEWAVQAGIMGPNEEGLVYPTDHITRQDFLTMLYRYEVRVAGNSTKEVLAALNAYTDRIELSTYAIIGMQWAVGSGLIISTSEEEMLLSPLTEVTRGTAAVILQRYLETH